MNAYVLKSCALAKGSADPLPGVLALAFDCGMDDPGITVALDLSGVAGIRGTVPSLVPGSITSLAALQLSKAPGDDIRAFRP